MPARVRRTLHLGSDDREVRTRVPSADRSGRDRAGIRNPGSSRRPIDVRRQLALEMGDELFSLPPSDLTCYIALWTPPRTVHTRPRPLWCANRMTTVVIASCHNTNHEHL